MPSDGIAKALARFYRIGRPAVLGNWPVLDEGLRPAEPGFRARLGIGADRPVALYQGGLQPHRGLALLVEAAAGVRMRGQPLPPSYRARSRDELRQCQMIYQMADTALNPNLRLRELIGRPAEMYLGLKGRALDERIRE